MFARRRLFGAHLTQWPAGAMELPATATPSAGQSGATASTQAACQMRQLCRRRSSHNPSHREGAAGKQRAIQGLGPWDPMTVIKVSAIALVPSRRLFREAVMPLGVMASRNPDSRVICNGLLMPRTMASIPSRAMQRSRSAVAQTDTMSRSSLKEWIFVPSSFGLRVPAGRYRASRPMR